MTDITKGYMQQLVTVLSEHSDLLFDGARGQEKRTIECFRKEDCRYIFVSTNDSIEFDDNRSQRTGRMG